jgi:hypothetical protein
VAALDPRPEVYTAVGKPKVYVETTVISDLTPWPSAETVTLAHQQITQEW